MSVHFSKNTKRFFGLSVPTCCGYDQQLPQNNPISVGYHSLGLYFLILYKCNNNYGPYLKKQITINLKCFVRSEISQTVWCPVYFLRPSRLVYQEALLGLLE